MTVKGGKIGHLVNVFISMLNVKLIFRRNVGVVCKWTSEKNVLKRMERKGIEDVALVQYP